MCIYIYVHVYVYVYIHILNLVRRSKFFNATVQFSCVNIAVAGFSCFLAMFLACQNFSSDLGFLFARCSCCVFCASFVSCLYVAVSFVSALCLVCHDSGSSLGFLFACC